MQDQFGESLEAFQRAWAKGLIGEQGNVYRFFADRWRDLSSEGQQYLEQRVQGEESNIAPAAQPTIAQRIALMRGYPPQGDPPSRPARELVEQLPALEDRLHRHLLEPAAATSEP